MANPVIAAYLRDLDWVSVQSTNVRRVGYLPDFRYLFVEFKGGATYLYEQVDAGVWEGLKAAPSKGQYVFYVLRNKGKDDRYPFRKVA